MGSVCAPIRGLLEATAALAFAADAVAEEVVCAAGGHARCEFVARRLAPASSTGTP